MKKTLLILAVCGAAAAFVTGCGLSASASVGFKGNTYTAGFDNNANSGTTTITGSEQTGTNAPTGGTITVKQ